MEPIRLGPFPTDGRDDDRLGEPKSGGLDKEGAGKDDDRLGDPKSGGLDKEGG